MSDINQVTIPQEFYVRTSDQLLIQPEPQYLFADLILRAMGATMSGLDGGIGLPGREIAADGAEYGRVEDDRLYIEPDMLSSNIFAVEIDFNGQPGNQVRINRPKYDDSTYTMAARRIDPSKSISTTGLKLNSEQAVLTLDWYGGPYGTTEIQPYVITRPTAKNQGVHGLVKLAKRHIIRDFHKTLDGFGRECLMDCATTIYPEGMSAVTDATTKGSFPLTLEQLNRTAKYMDEDLKLPTLPDGKRVLVLTPTGEKQLMDDPMFVRLAKEFETTNPLRRRYTNLKAILPSWYVFTSNTLDITANASSVKIHTGLAIAPGALGIGMGELPKVVNNSNDNYGFSVPIIWAATLAMELMDSRFAVKVVYAQDQD